jgi:hypothetical protein
VFNAFAFVCVHGGLFAKHANNIRQHEISYFITVAFWHIAIAKCEWQQLTGE